MAANAQRLAPALRAATAYAAAWLLLAQLAAGIDVNSDPFTLSESISGFSAQRFNGTWVNGSEIFYAKDGAMIVTDVSSNETRTVVPKEIMEMLQPEIITLSADGRFALLGHSVQKVYRHSTLANYTIYSVEDNTTFELCGDRLQLVRWSPVGSTLAFVYQNNLYYLTEPGANPTQVTEDGVPGVIYNGAADWVYEEEVLSTDGALWWSPSGSQVAFARFDDTRVHNASFMHYGTPGALADQYGEIVSLRYPKPGTTNPTVQLMVASLATDDTPEVTVRQLKAPTKEVCEDHLLYMVTWAGPDTILASWANRVGNVVQYMTYNTNNKEAPLEGEKGLKEEREDGWLDPPAAYFQEGKSSTYVTIAWQPEGSESFRQVVAVNGTTKTPITSGRATVTAIYGWDSKNNVYYQSTPVADAQRSPRQQRQTPQPSQRHVYSVSEGGVPRCLSCDAFSSEGRSCTYATASFSTDFSWFALTCSGPDPPIVTLHITAERAKSLARRVWEDNAELRDQLVGKQMPRAVDDSLQVGDGMQAQVRLLLPPGLDTSGLEKRPAVVFVYAGPDSQQIVDSFSIGFQHYITTSRRYIYVLIDARGSCCKGDKMLFSVNRKLGGIEIEDQIDITRRLKQKYPYIDGERTAIWGWSYGGYAAAMALAQDTEDVFSCGISVAPVTNWIYYDSIYTERYMGLPTKDDNEEGYNNSDVTRLAAQFTNKTFLLMHGTGDDNVHYQNSMMLARALEDAGVLFRQQSYPDQDHSMGSLVEHLYRSLDEFLEECFYKRDPPFSSASRMAGGLLSMASIAEYVL